MAPRTKKGRIKKAQLDYRLFDPKDGLHVNKIIRGTRICGYRYNMSLYDNDNIYMDVTGTGHRQAISIMHRVRKINRMKSLGLNKDKDRLNRKA